MSLQYQSSLSTEWKLGNNQQIKLQGNGYVIKVFIGGSMRIKVWQEFPIQNMNNLASVTRLRITRHLKPIVNISGVLMKSWIVILETINKMCSTSKEIDLESLEKL
jgi:hypothetical protein